MVGCVPMFEIDIQVDAGAEQYVPLLRAAIVETLQHEHVVPPVTVAVLLTDDAQLRQLNHNYRGYDKPTDVLSFTDGEAPFPDAPIHLGDLAISLPQTVRQAVAAGNTISAELQLLATHGTLHLLGYDHATAEEKAVMWQAQTQILAKLKGH